jgi:Flp pilus assembly pilin Flp
MFTANHEWRRGHADSREVSCVAALRFVEQIRTESAQTMAEYAVVLGVITLIVIAALTLLATNAANEFSRVASYLHF